MAKNMRSNNKPNRLLSFFLTIPLITTTFWNTTAEPTMKLATRPAEASAPSTVLTTSAQLQILYYIYLMYRTFLICLLSVIRIKMINEKEAQSPYERNREFKIIGIGALYAVLFVSQILSYTIMGLHQYIRHIQYYTILKFVGSFSAFLAPFSLLIVLAFPPNLNWIAYLVVFVMFGIIVASFYVDDHQQGKMERLFDLNDLVLLLVLLFTFLALIIPQSLNWFAYLVIYVSLWIESTYHFITYLVFIHQKTRKLEAHKLTKDKNNNYPRHNYLQDLGRN